MFDEMCRQKNARRVGQTHNNNSHAFSAYSFTSTGMTFLTVKIKNVSFTLGLMTFWDPVATYTLDLSINNI